MLDEPFSALDSYLKWQVELELAELLERFPGPVLFVTHDRDEVRRLCGRVCVLDNGRSQAAQSVGELFDSPRTLSACLLSGCKNITRARRVSEKRIVALDWGVELEVEQELPEGLEYAGIRAHFVEPVEGPGSKPAALPRGAGGDGGILNGGDACHTRRVGGLFPAEDGAAAGALGSPCGAARAVTGTGA